MIYFHALINVILDIGRIPMIKISVNNVLKNALLVQIMKHVHYVKTNIIYIIINAKLLVPIHIIKIKENANYAILKLVMKDVYNAKWKKDNAQNAKKKNGCISIILVSMIVKILIHPYLFILILILIFVISVQN